MYFGFLEKKKLWKCYITNLRNIRHSKYCLQILHQNPQTLDTCHLSKQGAGLLRSGVMAKAIAILLFLVLITLGDFLPHPLFSNFHFHFLDLTSLLIYHHFSFPLCLMFPICLIYSLCKKVGRCERITDRCQGITFLSCLYDFEFLSLLY